MTEEFGAAQIRQLDEVGYVSFRQALSQSEVAALILHLERLWLEEGDRAGEENYIEQGARRLANLANKGELFRPVFARPLVLRAAEHVLGPGFHLSMLNARDVPPGADRHMPFHADTDHGAKPDELGYAAATAIWMLDDFTAENGATRIIPGSHLTGLLPKEGMADVYLGHPEEVVMTGRAGDVVVFNGHCWHTSGENRSTRSRRAILAHYLRADQPLGPKRRQQVSAELQARLTKLELALLGLNDGS